MNYRALLLAVAGLCACEKTTASIGNVGQPAPAYGAPTLRGDSLRLNDLKGQVVLLNVWATWCIPCRKEIPELQALHQDYSGQGLRVVGVSVDDADADADVADFAKTYSMTYTILRDPTEVVSNTFAIPGVPASFLIDRSGVVRWRHLGPFKATDSTFSRTLNALLQPAKS